MLLELLGTFQGATYSYNTIQTFEICFLLILKYRARERINNIARSEKAGSRRVFTQIEPN